jgi:hypothetical protein
MAVYGTMSSSSGQKTGRNFIGTFVFERLGGAADVSILIDERE